MTDSGGYTLTVVPAKLTLSPLTDDSIGAGESYRKAVSAAYNGQGTLIFGAEGLPEGLAIDPDTGVISGATGETGGHRITVTVRETAGDLADTGSYTLTVTDEEGPGPGPGPVAYTVAFDSRAAPLWRARR